MNHFSFASFLSVGILLVIGMLLSIITKKLTIPAAATGGVIGFFVYCGAGFTGIAMMAIFFLLGSFATAWKIGTKEKLGMVEEDRGRRKTGQVIANGGVAALCGILVLLQPGYIDILVVMIAASLSSATADTLSSELGTVYGKSFYNIKNLKKDQRGLNGVISLEGCIIGIGGSIIIALMYGAGYGLNNSIFFIIVAGTVGNLADSYMGATLERKNLLSNNAVNFLNTLIAAMAAWGLCVLVK